MDGMGRNGQVMMIFYIGLQVLLGRYRTVQTLQMVPVDGIKSCASAPYVIQITTGDLSSYPESYPLSAAADISGLDRCSWHLNSPNHNTSNVVLAMASDMLSKIRAFPFRDGLFCA